MCKGRSQLSLWQVFSCIVRFENSGFNLNVCLKPQGNQVVYFVNIKHCFDNGSVGGVEKVHIFL